MFLPKLEEIHMGIILKKMAKEGDLDYDRILQCRTDFIKGIYELYMSTKNEEDTRDSLKRVINHTFNEK